MEQTLDSVSGMGIVAGSNYRKDIVAGSGSIPALAQALTFHEPIH